MIAMQQSVHNLCKGPPFPLLLMGYWACTVHAAWTDQKVKVSGQGTSIDLSVATPEHRISFSTYSLCNSFPCISLQPSSNNYNTIGTFTLSPHSSDPAITSLPFSSSALPSQSPTSPPQLSTTCSTLSTNSLQTKHPVFSFQPNPSPVSALSSSVPPHNFPYFISATCTYLARHPPLP